MKKIITVMHCDDFFCADGFQNYRTLLFFMG